MYLQCYLNLVVFPQGVRGYLIDLVRPPCGWSTGFFATPRTFALKPKQRKKPLWRLRIFFFNDNEEGPDRPIPYIENCFLTPEGNRISAVCRTKLIVSIFAYDPALRAYWIPRFGINSKFEIFLKVLSLKINEWKCQKNAFTWLTLKRYADVKVKIRDLTADGK